MFAFTETTSVAPREIPSVSMIESAEGTVARYERYCEFAIDAPAGRIAIEYNAEFAVSKLQTEIVDNTAAFDAGTVYRVVNVFAAGLDCPRILYT